MFGDRDELTLQLAAPEGISVEVGPAAAIDDQFYSRALTDPEAVILGRGTLETDDGWPVLVVRSDAGGEQRVHGFFRFDDVGVVVRATGADLDQHRDALLAMFRSAKPRYHDRVVALADVWANVVEDPR